MSAFAAAQNTYWFCIQHSTFNGISEYSVVGLFTNKYHYPTDQQFHSVDVHGIILFVLGLVKLLSGGIALFSKNSRKLFFWLFLGMVRIAVISSFGGLSVEQQLIVMQFNHITQPIFDVRTSCMRTTTGDEMQE